MENVFDAQPLLSYAMESTGLDDFGGQSFQEGLEVLVRSLNTDLELTEGLALYFQQVIAQLLINRLTVVALWKENETIQEQKIVAPIFIVGLPRSGTSITHLLLALDPLSRYLRNYETAGPLMPMAELIPRVPDARVTTVHGAMEGLFRQREELRAINGINFMALGPAECQNLMAHEFVHAGWSAGSSLFSHGNWLASCDMTQAYQWHKRLLQLLQWKAPNERWLLKAPIHLFGLDRLLETYPDARIVFTHRQPFEAMVSGVSMVAQWTSLTAGHADLPAIARWYPALWAKGLRHAVSVRRRLPQDRVVDLLHHELQHQPLQAMERVYRAFDIPFSATTRRRMEIWLGDNPRSSFGQHQPPDHGLQKEEEQERFDFYLEQLAELAA